MATKQYAEALKVFEKGLLHVESSSPAFEVPPLDLSPILKDLLGSVS